MFPNEYLNQEHHKDLLREAHQQRLALELQPSQGLSLSQRVGHVMLKLGAHFAVEDTEDCYTVETRGQVVTVCPAAC